MVDFLRINVVEKINGSYGEHGLLINPKKFRYLYAKFDEKDDLYIVFGIYDNNIGVRMSKESFGQLEQKLSIKIPFYNI